MHFTYFLLQMPPFVLMTACMLLFGLCGGVGAYLFRKYAKIQYLGSHNEVVGYVFGILGGFYALLMGFVVFFVWDALNQAQNNANQEGSLARGLYRDIRYHPDTAKIRPLLNCYLTYVHSVIDREYPDMERLKDFTVDDRRDFNNVFKEMEKLDRHDLRVEQMFKHLNDLANYRSLRILDGSSDIPIEIWVPLIIGAFIILLFGAFLNVESLRLHLVVNALLGAFIGMVIFLIIIINHPFSGRLRIKPEGYNTILQMANAGM